MLCNATLFWAFFRQHLFCKNEAYLVLLWQHTIVGSAFVKRLATGTPTQGLQAVEEFCQTLKAAITTTEAKKANSTFVNS